MYRFTEMVKSFFKAIGLSILFVIACGLIISPFAGIAYNLYMNIRQEKAFTIHTKAIRQNQQRIILLNEQLVDVLQQDEKKGRRR